MSDTVVVEEALPPNSYKAKDGSVREVGTGKFVKGNQLKPFNPGRPKRINVQEMLESISDAFPPERIVSIMNKAYEVAYKQQDAKQMMAVAQLALYYMVGKPVQRSITAQIDPDEFRRMFQPEKQQDEGEVIDVELQ